MADYTYAQLKEMKVAQLREVAKDVKHEAVDGYSTMHKEQLLPALCKALSIHVDHAAHGDKKSAIKATLRKLKARRDAAIAAKKHAELATVRHQIHTLKHKLRRMVDAHVPEPKPAAPAAKPA
jgi:protein-arginine kinase activator protein McsA